MSYINSRNIQRLFFITFLISSIAACSKDKTEDSALATLSGTISPAYSTYVDSDTNNPDAPYAPNNSADEAQLIPNSGTIGGFVAATGTGDDADRFGTEGDIFDSYRTFFSANQAITLTISNTELSQDLDLYLYSSSDLTEPVATSIGTGGSEYITVPTDDDYYIVVHAYTGSSNYILSIGQVGAALASKDILRLENAFVSEQVITQTKPAPVKFKGALSVDVQSMVAERHGMQLLRGGANGRPALLTVAPQATANHTNKTCCDPFDGRYGFTLNHEQRTAYKTIQAIKQLRTDKSIISAEPNYIRQSTATPNDTYYPIQWHYPLINLPLAWDQTTGDPNVIVAVIDTGIFLAHLDLSANLVDGYDMILSTLISNDEDGIDNNPDDPGDNATLSLSSFHGTHVAGTVAATSNNSEGVAGVAQNVKIMPIRVLGIGGGTDYDIIQGMFFAAGLSNDSGTLPAQAAGVINLSLGGAGYSQAAQDAVTAVRVAGTVIVAAAGNDTSSALFYPASYAGVISVSAIGYDKSLAPYSNFGSAIDIAAPGGDLSVDLNGDGNIDGVVSTWVDASSGTRLAAYGYMQGTSMASPHVAGVIALMKSVHSALTPDDVDSLLASGLLTEDISGDGATVRNNSFGYGMIDALKSVQEASALAAGAPAPLIPTVSPTSASIPSGQSSIELTVGQSGDGTISITDFNTDAPSWTTLTATSVDANGLGTYVLNIDTIGKADGVYTIIATFDADNGMSATATISMVLNSITLDTDAGRHYVSLLDPVTNNTLYSVGVSATNGTYAFTLSDIEPGSYYLTAGSDNDNDNFMCDAGEACGGYPLLSGLELITVTDDITGLDFVTSFTSSGALSLSVDSEKPFLLGFDRNIR